jgi:MoaA/NifB/PqqE/SkfB family radical SAM enzyme
MFYEIKVGGSGLRRDKEHPDRNYNPNRMIPVGKVWEILDDCKEMGVAGIQATGGGEPTVHPAFFDIIAGISDRGMKASYVTNGVTIGRKWKKLTDEQREAMVTASWARISLDAATPKTYCKIRNVDETHFAYATSAVKMLREHRDKLGTKLVIGVGFVVTPDNWHEAYNACELVKKLGADNIRISAQFSTKDEHLFGPFHHRCAAICQAAVRAFSDEKFQVYNRFGEKLDDLRLKRPDYDLCGYQMFTTYIGGDLNVYRCCVTSYNPHGLIGSLKEQRFRDLWMTQARQDDMQKFKASSCDRCQFNTPNRIIDYIIRAEDPEHSEFV